MSDNYRLIMRNVLDFFSKELPDVHVTEDILLKPTPESVKKIYSALLIHSGLKTEKQLLNDAETLSITDDPMLGGRRALALHKTMEYFVQNAMQNSSWSIRDLSSPNHRRTLILIRELISFYYFAYARFTELEGVFEERERRERDELQLKINLGSLMRQIEQKSKDADQLRARKHELYKERDELIRQNGQSRTSKNQIQEQHDLLKNSLDEKMRLKAKLEEQIREMEESNEDLRGKLVKSPDRLHAEIHDIEQKNLDRAQHIQDCEASINQMNQQIHILSTEADRHLNCFKGEFEMIRNDIRTFDKAQHDRTNLLMSIDREKARNSKLEGQKTELAQKLENDISDLNSQLQRCQNKIDHFRELTAQHNENIAIYNNKVENAQADYVTCQKRLEELKRQIEEHPTDPLKNLIQMKQQEIEAEIAEIKKCNDQLKKDIAQLDADIPTLHDQCEGVKQLGYDLSRMTV